MGPGPSPVPDAILQAMARPTLGHLDPDFLAIMDQTRGMLRAVFGTANDLTIPMSGTGSAGMETILVNTLEPGDRVLVGVNGVFGARMCEVARRYGAHITPVEGPWGRAFTPDDFRAAAGDRSYKAICLVHAETSTGVLQDLSGFRALADDLGALLLVDAVTSIGGLPIRLDEAGVDAAYAGTQKCLSCPPGLAPVSLSPRAVAALDARSTPVTSWYLDLSLIRRYWGGERAYHHTAPINMIYGLHEALRLALDEGLAARFARHRLHSRALCAGLTAMGLPPAVREAERLPPLTAVTIPDGIEDLPVRRHLLAHHGLEIGGGLGPMKGRVWRIGLMGHGARRANVELCLRALGDALAAQGFTPEGDGLEAAGAVYARG